MRGTRSYNHKTRRLETEDHRYLPQTWHVELEEEEEEEEEEENKSYYSVMMVKSVGQSHALVDRRLNIIQ